MSLQQKLDDAYKITSKATSKDNEFKQLQQQRDALEDQLGNQIGKAEGLQGQVKYLNKCLDESEGLVKELQTRQRLKWARRATRARTKWAATSKRE